MKVVVFGGWAVLSEHMSTTAFLIVRKSSRSKCRHNALPIQDTKNQTRRNPLSHSVTGWQNIKAGINADEEA